MGVAVLVPRDADARILEGQSEDEGAVDDDEHNDDDACGYPPRNHRCYSQRRCH